MSTTMGRGLVLCCCLASPACAMDPALLTGHWSGAFSRLGSVQCVEVHVRPGAGALVGSYDIPEMGLYEEPLKQITVSDSLVQLGLLYGIFDLHYHAEHEQMTGTNDRWKPAVGLHLKRVATRRKAEYETVRMTVESGGTTLAATFVRPASPGSVPALVAVPGSGPQGRETWEYRSHAYALARAGIGVLLYDKRGVGESQGDLASADFTTMARDAAAALDALRSRPDVLPGRTGLLGISQGGWLSAIACRLGARPDFVVLLQGPAVSLEKQELDRVAYSLRAEGYSEGAIDSALAHTRLYFDFINGAGEWQSLAASTEAVSGAAWVEFVNLPASADDPDLAWWRTNAYDPAEDLKRLSCPVLAVFGETDPNVPPAENADLMKRFLAEAGVEYEVVLVPALPHSVTTYQTLAGGEWEWPRSFWVWSRRPALLDSAMVTWILGL